MEIIIYSTETCGKCKLLEQRLKQKNIEYKKCTDIDLMLSKNIKTVPFLEINNKLMKFEDAWKWASKQEEN